MRTSTIRLALLLAVVGVCHPAVAQDGAKREEQKLAVAETKRAAKGDEKQGRRLPRHYGKVVDDAQREKIYAIQDSYRAQIEALEAQLAAINEKQDAEISAVLTAEQRTKLEQLTSEAKANRKKSVSIPNAASGAQEKSAAAK